MSSASLKNSDAAASDAHARHDNTDTDTDTEFYTDSSQLHFNDSVCTHCVRLELMRFGMSYLLDRILDVLVVEENVTRLAGVYGLTYSNLSSTTKHAVPTNKLQVHVENTGKVCIPAHMVERVEKGKESFSVNAVGYDMVDQDHVTRPAQMCVDVELNNFQERLVIREQMEFARAQQTQKRKIENAAPAFDIKAEMRKVDITSRKIDNKAKRNDAFFYRLNEAKKKRDAQRTAHERQLL